MAHRKPTLDRRKVVAEILSRRGDALVMPGLGAPTWDCAAAGDHPLTFYSWGGMGGCAMMGLGLALIGPGARSVRVRSQFGSPTTTSVVLCPRSSFGR